MNDIEKLRKIYKRIDSLTSYIYIYIYIHIREVK